MKEEKLGALLKNLFLQLFFSLIWHMHKLIRWLCRGEKERDVS